MIKKIIDRIALHGLLQSFVYAFYRFSFLRRLTKLKNTLFFKSKPYDLSDSIFKGLDVDKAMTALEVDAFTDSNFNIPENFTREIQDYAKNNVCYITEISEAKVFFLSTEKEQAEKKLGTKILMAHYENCAKNCPALGIIEKDPKILEITRRFLGRYPKKIDTLLWWSFRSSASLEERLKANQTVLFHYDVVGALFIYFNFYLTDTDEKNGAHVAVKGSHRKKKMGYLFHSAYNSDEEIARFYGTDKIRTLKGPAGYGFAEDAYCFHKASVPIEGNRLFLQIRMT